MAETGRTGHTATLNSNVINLFTSNYIENALNWNFDETKNERRAEKETKQQIKYIWHTSLHPNERPRTVLTSCTMKIQLN